MYREHNAAAFPADDASPIPPRAVPKAWDWECDMVVVGAGGGGLNAAARAAELGADVICVEALDFTAETRSPRACAASWAACPCRRRGSSRSLSYPFDAQALTDWAMDEYHYAADPKLIYKIALRGRQEPRLDGGLRRAVALGRGACVRGSENATLDHHVLKMKDATDAMFVYGQRKRRALSLPVPCGRARAR